MIIFIPYITRAFSFKPIIGIPKKYKNDKEYIDRIVAHEKAHYGRQGYMPIIWVLRYFLSKKFRWQEEKMAYIAELNYLSNNGYLVYKQHYIEVLTTQYWDMCSIQDATDLVNKY